jgi:hypothetical protein
LENIPNPPKLEFVFEIRAEVKEIYSGGKGLYGERLHIPIIGGEVSGPKLNGRILPGGSDWALLRKDKNSAIDAHYTIIADDGTPIYVKNKGMRVSSSEVLERLQAGEPVDPSELYFRSAPVFEAPEGPHAWLMNRIFVANLAKVGNCIHVQVFSIL